MKKLVILFYIVFGWSVFAGTGISVIVSSGNASPKYLKSQNTVKVVLKNNKYFTVEKYLGEKGDSYLFIKDGKRVCFPKAVVKEIKLTMETESDGKTENAEQTTQTDKKQTTSKKSLILTDYNVEKHYYTVEDQNEGNGEKEENKSSGLRVSVLNQVVSRKGDTVSFKADIKNITGLTVGKLSIILNIYDVNGKLVETKKVFLANTLANGKSVPFQYSMKDPEGKITRFDYSFEGIVYAPKPKGE